MHYIKKYCNADPLPWLMEKQDDPACFITKRDILREKFSDREYDELAKLPVLQKILGNSSNSVLRDSSQYDIFYTGTLWNFAVSVEYGLDTRTSEIQKTAEFLCKKSQNRDGGFTFNWKPNIPVACRTGDTVRYLIRSGYRGQNVRKGIEWIVKNQRHDGGWLHCPLAGICDYGRFILLNKPGKGLRRENDTTVPSCIAATIACSYALIEYRDRYELYDHDRFIEKGAQFILSYNIENRRSMTLSCMATDNRDFTLLGYPILSQYDIVYGLLFLARSGYYTDLRTSSGFNLVISKQNPNGTWNLENAQTGMMYREMKKPPVGRMNKWVTLNVLRLLSFGSSSLQHDSVTSFHNQ